MTTTTRTRRPDQAERRVEVRLTPREHDRLMDSARWVMRSTSAQARHMIVQALSDEHSDRTVRR